MNQRTKEELSPNMKRRFLKEWNETIFTLFWKIWVITLFVELLLFCFFKPVPECSRLRYFYLYSEWSGIDYSYSIPACFSGNYFLPRPPYDIISGRSAHCGLHCK